MPDEIDLNEDEEAALERAWAKMEGKLPPPSPLLADGDEPGSGKPGAAVPVQPPPPPSED